VKPPRASTNWALLCEARVRRRHHLFLELWMHRVDIVRAVDHGETGPQLRDFLQKEAGDITRARP